MEPPIASVQHHRIGGRLEAQSMAVWSPFTTWIDELVKWRKTSDRIG